MKPTFWGQADQKKFPTESSVSCYDGYWPDNSAGSEDSWGRTCSYENICYVRNTQQWKFYGRSKSLVFPQGKEFGTAGDPAVGFDIPAVELRGWVWNTQKNVWWAPDFVNSSVPSDVRWVESTCAMIIPRSAENFGHVLGDFIFVVYRMMEIFEIPERDIRIIVAHHPSAEPLSLSIRPRVIQWTEELCALLWPKARVLFADHGYTSSFMQQTAIPTRDENASGSNKICYRRMIAGVGKLGMTGVAGDGWQRFTNDILKSFKLPRSYCHANRHTLRALAIDKVGRRRIFNIADVVAAAEQHLNISIDMLTSDLVGAMSIRRQIATILEYDIVISPPGGLSLITAFMKPGSAVIISSIYIPGREDPIRLDQSLWRFVTNRLILHYPVTLDEELVKAKRNVTMGEYDYYRDYVDIKMNTTKLCGLLERAVLYVRRYKCERYF
jgi:Glycosyltransferase 61